MSPSSDRTLTEQEPFHATKAQLKRATRARLRWALFTSLLLLASIAFIILVELGNVKINSVLNNIYFIKLNLTNVVPTSVPNSVLINSIAQTLGLHDFYTVGLWNFCEGNNGVGVTHCSSPKSLYWFNPVDILQSELLAGATIALPAEIDTILHIIRIVSFWMFALFLVGIILSFIMVFLAPLAVYTRWASLPIVIVTFLAALFTTVAAILATVMFIIMQTAITSVTELNIGASIGIEMFIFMWIGAITSVLAFVIQFGMCCCCASRRDVKTGRKRGSKHAWEITSEKESHVGNREPGGFSTERPQRNLDVDSDAEN
ncbi:Hypothetical protein R9X50_00391200 [Acrodontium crateriforme]|uniref:Integral membrane protein n=1 Tax=Acrodontium crateriforme TaxID=150365 RepID=A0AAQ3M3E4_9PEZI|nr:Hypothetical protein R9X50_00391200 [Acrodontium crateriforme]